MLGYEKASKGLPEEEEIVEETAFSPLAFTKDFLRQPKNQPGKFQKIIYFEHSLKVPESYETVIPVKA